MVEPGRLSQRSHNIPSQRLSQRSHGTSSSSSHDSHMVCKDCCRGFISFMCTQVGVGGLLIAYAALGAAAFMEIEAKGDYTNTTSDAHNTAVTDLWKWIELHNNLDKSQWHEDVNGTLLTFQKSVVTAIQGGYKKYPQDKIWTYSATLMFCLSVFTMIGYGHMTPKKDLGKIATIFYAVLGIPLYVVYFMNMGRVFANIFRFLYRKLYMCLNRDQMPGNQMEEGEWQEPMIIVPSTACIWVMILYILLGTVIFAEWEGWDYLDSCYFSFTSLAKIGFGDFVPGVGENGKDKELWESKILMVVNFAYLLIGMALIAMCYTLMKEEMQLKLHTLHHELKEKCFYCGLRIGLYTDEQPINAQRKKGKTVRRAVVRRR